MHFDRLGDLGEGQRPKRRHALLEEALLLLDDLARHLDDRPRPLVERLHQPVGAGQALAEPGLRRLVLRPALQLGMIAAVDQHPGQRRIVELDRPAAAGAPDEHVGGNCFGLRADEAAAGLGVICPKLADHVGEILLVDPADAAKIGHPPLASRSRLAISRAIAGS